MIKIEVNKSLASEIRKKFNKKDRLEIRNLFDSLIDNPNKGKPLTNIKNFLLKELKYKSFRFYFITDGFKLKLLNKQELKDLLIKFIAMSDKTHQQTVIEEIKNLFF
ncbi:MAG: hypothetical protein AB7V77_05775 [Candidatus Woesearchaeota archaeon]